MEGEGGEGWVGMGAVEERATTKTLPPHDPILFEGSVKADGPIKGLHESAVILKLLQGPECLKNH